MLRPCRLASNPPPLQGYDCKYDANSTTLGKITDTPNIPRYPKRDTMTTTKCSTYGHDWDDTQPTRLREIYEDDQTLRCAQCGSRRFVNPGPTTIVMPPGFSPITLHTLHYDTTTKPGGVPSAREIYIRQRHGLPHKTTLKRIMDLYPTASIAAITNKWPEVRGTLTFRPWHELPTEVKDHIANLADGPVSAHMLTEETLLDATTIPHDHPSERISVQEHLDQWLRLTQASAHQRYSTMQLVPTCADPTVSEQASTQILTHLETNAELPAGSLQAMRKIRPLMAPETNETVLHLYVSPASKGDQQA